MKDCRLFFKYRTLFTLRKEKKKLMFDISFRPLLIQLRIINSGIEYADCVSSEG